MLRNFEPNKSMQFRNFRVCRNRNFLKIIELITREHNILFRGSAFVEVILVSMLYLVTKDSFMLQVYLFKELNQFLLLILVEFLKAIIESMEDYVKLISLLVHSSTLQFLYINTYTFRHLLCNLCHAAGS